MRESNRLTPLFVSKHTVAGRYHDGDGLYLQISQWGTKAWVLRYMLNGQPRMMGLGSVKDFTLKEARERARLQRQLLRGDKRQDPLEVRRRSNDEARLEAAKSVTFASATDAYIKAHAPGWKNPKHQLQWRNTLTTYAFPIFGDLPVASINVGLVLQAIEPHWSTKTETASRVRGRIESVLDWLDSLFADFPTVSASGPVAVHRPESTAAKPKAVEPPLRGIDALIARYTSEGLSQREIARRLNVGKGTVQRRQCAQRELFQV